VQSWIVLEMLVQSVQ